MATEGETREVYQRCWGPSNEKANLALVVNDDRQEGMMDLEAAVVFDET
jgi:hypothetical protein